MAHKGEAFSLMGMPTALGCNLSFYHIGRLTTQGGHHFSFGGYNCWHVVAEGRGYVRSGENDYELNSGDMFSVMFDNHIEYGPYPGEDWTFYYIRTTGEGADALSRKIGLLPERPWLRPAAPKAVLRLFVSAWEAARNNNQTPEFCTGIVYQIAALLCAVQRPTVRTPEALVDEALRLIHDPLSRNFNVNQLAMALHVSRVTLFNAFKQTTGQSPRQHLTAAQIEYVKALLLDNPATSIAELAESTTYSSDKTLISTFKRVTGMTPGEFRRREAEE